jgi:hypothetical protein
VKYKSFFKVKCKFGYRNQIEMPYEEVYFQKMEDEKQEKSKSKK